MEEWDAIWNDESTSSTELTSSTQNTSSSSSSDDSSSSSWYKCHHPNISAEPAIEVYHINIFKKSFIEDREEEFRVYGIIRVVDKKSGKKCLLYNRDVGDDHLDVISFGHNALTLTGPDSVISMKEPEIFIDIKDEATGASVVKGSGILHNATTDEFEQLHFLVIRGEGGARVDVEYIALRFGIAAVLEIEPMEYCEGVSDEESFGIYGSISAYYNNAYFKPKITKSTEAEKRLDFHSMRKRFCTKLFNKPEVEDSQVVSFESPINLSRTLVVVPSYSSLVIDFDLRDSKTEESIVNGNVVMETAPNCRTKMDILGRSNLKMRVRVNWKVPVLLDETSYNERLVPNFCLDTLPNRMLLRSLTLVEIFSVIIGRHNDEELSLYGKIYVHDSVIGCNIFTATKEDPYVLSSGCKRLPLKCPSRTMKPGDHFSVKVELRDVKRRIYINEYLVAGYWVSLCGKTWHERRLCSVIKGVNEDGFAAVNYMVLPRSIKAVVKVGIKYTTDDDRVGLYGKIVAFYGKYEYTRYNDWEDYRCVLFERSKESCSAPDGDNSQVKLSRSVIPVPLDSSLLVEVDLKLGLVGGAVYHVHDIAKFQPGELFPTFDIKRDQFAINVSVEWNHGF